VLLLLLLLQKEYDGLQGCAAEALRIFKGQEV
jgi:hypothetical protein